MKRYKFTESRSFQLDVCLSMYLLVGIKRKRDTKQNSDDISGYTKLNL